MPTDSRDDIELQVIQDVIDIVESRLREREQHGWRLTVPRSRVYATVLHAVMLSARAACIVPATLDRADILDAIFDGIEPADSAAAERNPVDDTIRHHVVPVN
ncbi:hypothetical protein [Nocardia inohanensis]|uniref:hypothetical protein n=1 Tax=Nocardia inohanensis TaxID=209246 RepID=UPI00082B2446|nr:hypothetical protein [Nocardia inohanensis]